MNEKNDAECRAFRIGPIRPPSEADSLLLQVTNGCTWNRCKFCGLYKHTKFKAYSADSIKADIDNMVYYAEIVRKYETPLGAWDVEGLNREMESFASDEERQCFYMMANWLLRGGENVFLQDGNTTALSSGRLSDVLIYLRQAFPQIKRITSYGRAQNLAKTSAEGYAELKAAGLDRIHSGFESGSDAVLEKINKGVTAEEEITAGRNIKAGGIELSIYFMPGVGGRELTRENAEGTADVVNAIGPDFLRIRTAALKKGTELYEDYCAGNFTLASDEEKLLEIRRVIELAADIDTYVVSDHIINLLQSVEGYMVRERAKLLAVIDDYLAKPERERRIYQAARRMAIVGGTEHMKELARRPRTAGLLKEIEAMVDRCEDPELWEQRMNDMAARYI